MNRYSTVYPALSRDQEDVEEVGNDLTFLFFEITILLSVLHWLVVVTIIKKLVLLCYDSFIHELLNETWLCLRWWYIHRNVATTTFKVIHIRILKFLQIVHAVQRGSMRCRAALAVVVRMSPVMNLFKLLVLIFLIQYRLLFVLGACFINSLSFEPL